MKKSLLLLLFLSIQNLFSQPFWYKTQIGTGEGNCGPATVAMAIQWATGASFTVQQIRSEVGNPYISGITSYPVLMAPLIRHNVIVQLIQIQNIQDLINLVSQSDIILIVSIKTQFITPSSGNSLYGRTYPDQVGHYIILEDVLGDSFKVQDPLNSPDRFYKILEVWEAMGKKNNSVLVVYSR